MCSSLLAHFGCSRSSNPGILPNIVHNLKTPGIENGTLGFKEEFKKDITEWTHLWYNDLLSNIEYLSICNFYADRSFEDLAQYPIFPWLFSSYKSTATLRDLN